MKFDDTLGFAFRSLRGYPLRTGLMLLAMAIGVASVVLLTAASLTRVPSAVGVTSRRI